MHVCACMCLYMCMHVCVCACVELVCIVGVCMFQYFTMLSVISTVSMFVCLKES